MLAERRLVWDLPLRVFHWLLAVSICSSWATAKAGFDWMQIHFWLGYTTIGLIVFRIIWGFIGPRHARFSSFLVHPVHVWRYVKDIAGGGVAHTIGHNPLGGLMVILMLLLLAFQATTGLFASDDIVWSGPYNAAVSSATAKTLTRLHHLNFNLLLTAVILHITAILYYWLLKKQNLVVPMLTGRKPAALVPPQDAIQDSALLRALIAILVSGGAVYWLITAAPAEASLY